ncbi:benzoylformate decarboxylase [Burkholderia sp. USMB20]|uniref:benzoylformate decarboxylase n=1 Tax=Burkholderia sp. USMB20 TaxID=1571773 RepID=UPI0005CF08A7|nr:benzoylformate decarboxylase [Burkholderia sp. USMB20]TGN95701.1 benzoylformate decarboxylase [Burkholderia sp. USMB20]
MRESQPLSDLSCLQPSGEISVREAVLRLLRAFRMTTIFGNPGSTELPMLGDFPADFRYVLGLQESVVVGMADGYAQATRNAALVNLHSAAGVGHAMGNIFTAYKNRTPLVITAGQQARSILPFEPFLFSAQATELPKPYVKWSCEPARAQDVPAAIARAYYIAMQPPCGPTFVSIPVDDWNQMTEPVEPRSVSLALRPDPVALDVVGTALDRCARPVFVVGAAVDRDGAWDETVALAERHNALVWVSPTSGRCSFPESHPLFAGFLPASREAIVARLTGYDLVLSLGAPIFTYHVEGFGPHIPAGADLYQLTDDPDVAAWAPVGTSVVTSLRLGLSDLLTRPASRPRAVPAGRASPPAVPATSPISVAYLMQTLATVRPGDSIVVEEAPSSRPFMQAYLPFDRSESFYTCSSGGLGHGLPAAVGVALAKAPRRVIGLLGDGSSMYAIQALWSAAQLKLPITFVIVNNRKYAALEEFASLFKITQAVGTRLPGIDFSGLAHSMGCAAMQVEQAEQLEGALRAALEARLPTLVEVFVA